MEVFVKLPTGKTIILGVEASYTVYAVKILIQGKSGFPVFDQRLIFAGAPLEDDHSLRNYNIQDKSRLEMTLRSRGGMWDAQQKQWTQGTRDRSRTPGPPFRAGPSRSQGISRAVVKFGRYPGKRPPGLAVTEDGVIELENLMQSWGRGQGFQERDIMRAIWEHMFHSDDGDGFSCLRFSIDSDPDGKMMIRVHPKRGYAKVVNTLGGDALEEEDGDEEEALAYPAKEPASSAASGRERT